MKISAFESDAFLGRTERVYFDNRESVFLKTLQKIFNHFKMSPFHPLPRQRRRTFNSNAEPVTHQASFSLPPHNSATFSLKDSTGDQNTVEAETINLYKKPPLLVSLNVIKIDLEADHLFARMFEEFTNQLR